jgi:plasmid stabilization system protein ParE
LPVYARRAPPGDPRRGRDGLRFHPDATLDLEEIWDFIADRSLDAADQVTARILAAIAGLVTFPNQGRQRPDLTSRPLRFLVVHEYLIATRLTQSRYGLSP